MALNQINKIDFVCINVQSNLKRREHIQHIAQECAIPIRFFKAITPADLPNMIYNYAPERTRLWWKRALLPTEQACSLSHLTIWQEFLKSDNDYLIVFEDDVQVNKDFMKLIESLSVQNLLMDFLKLSGQHERPARFFKHTNFEEYQLFLNAYGPLDAACYGLSKAGAKQLLAYCQTMHMAIDVLMDRTYDHHVPCYTIRPYPVYPIQDEGGDFVSQIGFKERQIDFDHNILWKKCVFRLLRAYSSCKKRWATVKLLWNIA